LQNLALRETVQQQALQCHSDSSQVHVAGIAATLYRL
jgi:hypothetical protein